MATNTPETIYFTKTQRTYCAYTHPDGVRCWGLARLKSRFCYWHDPDTERERQTKPPKTPLPLAEGSGASSPATPAEAQDLLRKIGRYLATADLPDVGRCHALSTVALHLIQRATLRTRAELRSVQRETRHLEKHLARQEAQKRKEERRRQRDQKRQQKAEQLHSQEEQTNED